MFKKKVNTMELIQKIIRTIFLNPFRKRQYIIHNQIAQQPIDNTKKYAVVRDNGNIIVQFYFLNEAKNFSDQLNSSYKENGLRVKSSVIHMQDFINSKKEFYYIQ
jgi:hypothetical protein